jgi:DNA-directed RNA polymerase specialized sigma24 family protein
MDREEVPAALLSMVKMLAEAPENQRITMLESRLREFAAMADKQRAEAMAQMIKAVATLPPDKRVTLAKSRIDCLCEKFDPSTRKALAATHMMALMNVPEATRKADLEATFGCLNQVSAKNRSEFANTMKAIMAELPAQQREMMMSQLPPEARAMLGT